MPWRTKKTVCVQGQSRMRVRPTTLPMKIDCQTYEKTLCKKEHKDSMFYGRLTFWMIQPDRFQSR